jgi:hypothetical protein
MSALTPGPALLPRGPVLERNLSNLSVLPPIPCQRRDHDGTEQRTNSPNCHRSVTEMTSDQRIYVGSPNGI